MAVGGRTGEAFVDHLRRAHRGVAPAHFRDPAAVEGCHGVASGQIHAEAHELIQSKGLIPGVRQHRPANDCRWEGRVEQGQLPAGLAQGDFQGFRGVMRLGKTAGHGDAALMDFIAGVAKIPRLPCQLQRRFPVVSPSASAPFQRQDVRTAGGVLRVKENAGSPAQTGAAAEGACVPGLYRRAEMQMLRKTVGIDFEQVGISIRPDVEYAVFLGNHSQTRLSFFFHFIRRISPCQRDFLVTNQGFRAIM